MEKLNILGYSYTLKTDETIDEMGGNVGLTNFNEKFLQIASNLDADQKSSVFIHELIEAINYHLELDLTHPQIMGLEVALNQTLRDNGVDFSTIVVDKKKETYDRDTGKHSRTVLLKA
jgi:hypothetical protein